MNRRGFLEILSSLPFFGIFTKKKEPPVCGTTTVYGCINYPDRTRWIHKIPVNSDNPIECRITMVTDRIKHRQAIVPVVYNKKEGYWRQLIDYKQLDQDSSLITMGFRENEFCEPDLIDEVFQYNQELWDKMEKDKHNYYQMTHEFYMKDIRYRVVDITPDDSWDIPPTIYEN